MAGSCFPRIFGGEKEKFFSFLQAVGEARPDILAVILVHSQDREEIIAKLRDFIKEDEKRWESLVWNSMKSSGKSLFKLMKQEQLLNFDILDKRSAPSGHVDALKWLECNGIDVLKDPGF